MDFKTCWKVKGWSWKTDSVHDLIDSWLAWLPSLVSFISKPSWYASSGTREARNYAILGSNCCSSWATTHDSWAPSPNEEGEMNRSRSSCWGYLLICCLLWKMNSSLDMDLILQQGLKKLLVVINPSLLNKFLNILKTSISSNLLVQISCFIDGSVTRFLQHPNGFFFKFKF